MNRNSVFSALMAMTLGLSCSLELNAATVNEEVAELLKSKHKLTYNADGSFKVMIFADIHMNGGAGDAKINAAKEKIKLLVDREKPNLVIMTGDNILYSRLPEYVKNNVAAIAGYLEEKKIPWCHVYGNHDHEHAISKEEQQKIYESFEYCISKDVEELSGVGNYVHGVWNADGTLGSVIYCLDSGTYDSEKGGYDYIKPDQIAWYKKTSELLQKYNKGKLVPGIMAFHIPLIENNEAHNNRDNPAIVKTYTGNKNENICSSKTDTELFETIVARGDISAIVTGHDHVNDYMYHYKGVKLASSPNFSEMTYTNPNVQGARVFDLNTATISDVPTYVSYIKERLDSSKFGAFPNNVTLDNFNTKIKKPGVSGYDGGAYEGKIKVALSANGGVSGTIALMVARDKTGNFEVTLPFKSVATLGQNKYLVVWMNFSNVEFRKACVGLLSSEGNSTAYRVDDNDGTSPEFYFLADGSSEWQTLKHGWDGCFGVGNSCPIKGKKGYFAFPTSSLKQGSKAMKPDTLVSGFYFYGDIASGEFANVPFYFDDIKLVDDYKTQIK